MSELKVSVLDRIVSAISYLTAGWGGLIYTVILYFRKKRMSCFLHFNIFQSIFISVLFIVIAMGMDFIFKILSFIPFINYLAAQVAFIFNRPILFDYSLIQVFITAILIYVVVMSILGRYPRIYKISKIIDYSTRSRY